MWNDIDMKFMHENIFRGRPYSRKPCMYLLISLEYIPNELKPGNSVNKLSMNELALEEECAKTTILF